MSDPTIPPPGPPPSPVDPPEGQSLRTAGMVDPQRLLRVAGVTREVLEEARRIRPEEGSVDHLRRVLDAIQAELREALPDELYQELDELTPDIRSGTLEELALAHAEILGWLEGLFQGTQLAIQLQAARALGEGRPGPPRPPGEEPDSPDSRYL
jgi:proteasome activator-like protein